jgi:hypothetical protein
MSNNTPKRKTVYRDSPVGIAVHPWINNPDVKFNAEGLFKSPLLLRGADAEKLMESIKKEAEAAFEDLTQEMSPGERKKWKLYLPFQEVEDDQGNPTGDVKFDFKQNAKIKLRDGTTKDVKIAVYDAAGNDIVNCPPIFSGSQLRVRYSMRPIKMVSTKQAGVRLDFSSVQIKKLMGGTGAGGFGKLDGDDGYIHDEADAADATHTQGSNVDANKGDY